MTDANAQLASTMSSSVDHAQHIRADLANTGCTELTTHPEICNTELHTYITSATGGVQIDYIASKGAVRVEPHSAGAILGFETMVDVDDHIPVYVALCLLPSHKRMLLSRRSTPYNRKALLLPANVAKLQ